MRHILLFLFIVCVSCQSSVSAQSNPSEIIVFDVYDICAELHPLDANELVAMFNDASDYDSKNVAAIENLNRRNIFNKPDEDVGYRIFFEFYADIEGKWQFDMIYDAGIASCLLIDQNDVVFFSDIDKYLSNNKPLVKSAVLKQGWHHFEFLALENCCGSPIRFRVKKPNMNEFVVISDKVLQLRSISQ